MPLTLQRINHGWRLSQSQQAYKALFSHCKKEGDVITALHEPVLCRDYLMDQLVEAKKPKTLKDMIYGYQVWKVPSNPDYPEFYLEGEVNELEENMGRLHEIEDGLEIKRTEITKVGDGYYVKGDPWWHTTTLHLSWYTYMLRMMGAVKVDMKKNTCCGAFAHTWKLFKGLPQCLKTSGYDSLTQYKTVNSVYVHGYSGFYTLNNYVASYRNLETIPDFNWTPSLIKECRKWL